MYFKNDFFHGAAYQRLHTVATVLERFVAAAPREVSVVRLQNEVDIRLSELHKICLDLCKTGLIVGIGVDHWALASEPSDITLEDVWRVVMADRTLVGKNETANDNCPPANYIDLLIGQALLAINQSVASHLRKCQLDRVKASQCGFRMTTD